jgi:hypothetical protein
MKILAGAVFVIILIVIALYLLQSFGIVKILPSASPAVTSPSLPVPVVTTPAGTELPTEIPTETPELIPATSDTPAGTPAPSKATVCPSDRRACGFTCADVMTDSNHCGDCDVTCFSGQICQMGHCQNECNFGEISCFDGCHNLSVDANNCGTCGNTCPFGLICNRSVCSPTVTTVVPTYLG